MPGRRIASAGLGLTHRSICRPVSASLRALLSSRSTATSTVADPSRQRTPPSSRCGVPSSNAELDYPKRKTWSRAVFATAPLTVTGIPDAPSSGIGTYLADLLLSSPLPSHGLTIIVITLLARTCITLPITAWQNRRMRRLMMAQAPDMKPIADRIAREIGPTAARNNWTNEMFQEEIRVRVNAEYESLMKPLKAKQRWLRFIPLLANLPILIGFSYAIRTALSMPGSPLPNESFLWIERLGEVDVGIGIAGLLITFLNAEVQSRNSLKLLDKEEEEAAQRKERIERQESLAAEREKQDARRTRAMREYMRPIKKDDKAGLKPAPLSMKASKAAAAAAKKPQQQAKKTTTPTKPAAPASQLASQRSRPFADDAPAVADIRDFPRTPAGTWAWAKTKFEKTLSPAYTLHIFSKFSRAYGVGFFVLASMFVPSGLCLYWITSMAYTLVQTSALSFFGKEAKPAVELKTKAPDAGK